MEVLLDIPPFFRYRSAKRTSADIFSECLPLRQEALFTFVAASLGAENGYRKSGWQRRDNACAHSLGVLFAMCIRRYP
jgi:hypothetical protein